MWDFRYRLSTGNAMMGFKEKHSLLLECFMTFLIYIYEWLEELQIAYRSPLWFSTCCATSTDNNSHISWNISDFRYLLSTWNGTLCCNERHALLLECVMTFLKYIKWIWRALYSIYKPSIVHIMFFLPISNYMQNINIRAASKHQNWVALIQEEASIGAEVFYNLSMMYKHDWESFSTNPLWSIACRFPSKVISNCMQNV